ncbi:centrosomal protein of 135 kDa-like [Liolophura sinensis]|uniref:centrosomal protein of 135 kDa-like n=1 Tax=Liolophura sinensis TaxID=3198878 RepID=UPI0031582B3B
MGSTNPEQAQQKFSNLRKRLDQLGYRQPLGLESLPLVERLFADLIHTTESLKNAKLEISKKQEDHGSFETAVEPYKSDNAKLVKENNELHIQIIKQTEEANATVRDLKASLRKLEHENTDLKFLNNQYVHKVRQLEQEAREKADRIIHLQEKNFHAVVQTPGGKKKTIPFRRQRMQIDSTVPAAEIVAKQAALAEDPYVADLLQVADSKIAELNKQVKTLTDLNDVKERKLKNFKQQVEARDAEIDRLSRMLDGGRPSDVVALESRNRANERMISHLNIQVDYLQQKSRELEMKMKESTLAQEESESKARRYQARITDLELELSDVDRMAKRLQSDKEFVVKAADNELSEAKVELEKSRYELEGLDLETSQMKAENKRLKAENLELRNEVQSKTADVIRLEDLLDKIQIDKRRLTQRVNKLTANEKDLVLEIERLKHKNGPTTTKKRSKSLSKLDSFIRALEEERNFYREQSEALQVTLRRVNSQPKIKSPTPKPPSRSNSRSSSPVREPSPTKLDKKTVAKYEAMIRVLEEERDNYKRELDAAKAIRRPASPVRLTPTKSLYAESSEIAMLTRERDELQGLLDKFERHMAEIQANVKVLASERDQLNTVYEETRTELQKVRRELIRSPKSPKSSLAAQAVLRRVENEKEDALAELRRVSTERDSLRERLKIATETSLSDRAKLEQRVEDLKSALSAIEVERDELSARVSMLKTSLGSCQDQVREQAMVLGQSTDNLSQQKATAAQMKLLAEEAERRLEECQRKLNRRDADLQTLEDRNSHLEKRIGELQRGTQQIQDEIIQLRSTINALDREKDTLQAEVDEKTEKIAVQQDDILNKERQIGDLKVRVSELEAQLDHAGDSSDLKDRENKSLRRQLEGTGEDLAEAMRSRDVAVRENRRLQDDLAVMTRENQKVNEELQDALDQKELLKQQVNDYIREVKATEELLSSKEQERSDLLEQYRQLSQEAELYQTTSHALESEGSTLKMELMSKDSEIRRLREKVDAQNSELTSMSQSCHSYDVQLSQLTRNVSQLEDSLRHAEDEKQSMLQDLAAVRDLCTRLEANKESLQRQLTASMLDKEQLQNALEDLKQEATLCKTQLSSERSSIKNLEDLLANTREKEFQSQLSAQEKSAESQLVKDKLSLNESKLQSQHREIASLRTRLVELEADLERTRRQLTNERYEKERALQDLHRQGMSSLNDSSLRLSRSSRSPARYRTTETSYTSTASHRRSVERSLGLHEDRDQSQSQDAL